MKSIERPLTILTLVSGDGRAGADKLAFEVSLGLGRRGHEIILGCPSNFYLLDEARKSGLRTYILNPSGSMDMTVLPSFVKFCRDKKIDIVNVHHSHGRHLLVAAKLLRIGAKAVFVRHCISGSLPYVGAFFYNLFGTSIAVSATVRNSLLAGGILASNLATIYGGVNIEHFSEVPHDLVEECRAKYSRNGVFTIGIVARLCLHKGNRTDKPTQKRHEVLFRALARIKEEFNLLVLGADRKYIDILAAENGLDPKKITCCGFQENIAPFYKIMDLNVLPSPNEGLGLAVIEAMAAGVPCIGANKGGLREIISNGLDGFLFEPGNSEDLANKIRLVMDDEKTRYSFVEKGRKKVRDLFDIENTIKETEKIFCSLTQMGSAHQNSNNDAIRINKPFFWGKSRI